jgi:hypothetical protein
MTKRSNKFGELSKLFSPLNILLLIVVIVIVIVTVTVSVMGSSGGSGSSGTAPLPKMVNGWSSDLFFNHLLKDTYTTDPGREYTLEQCQQLASSTPGVKYFTHRNAGHPDPALRNTCILYNTPSDYVVNIDVGGDPSIPGDTRTGCVDPSKTWPNCN